MPYPKSKIPEGGIKSPIPVFIPPALATSIGKVPSGERWVHEVKFDGYRVQLHIANETIKVLTRRGHDWTDRFKKIATDAWHLKVKSAIIDGEVVVPAVDGTTDFAVLQKALRAGQPSGKLVMYAFDLLYLNGYDMRRHRSASANRHLRRCSRAATSSSAKASRPTARTCSKACVRWGSKASSPS
jgi:bifunctional non-homologous end joining protein LigD